MLSFMNSVSSYKCKPILIKMWKISISLFCLVVSALPSGTVGNYNLKLILTGFCALAFFLAFTSQKINASAIKALLICLCSGLAIGFWVINNQSFSISYAIGQYQGFFTTFLVCGILIFAYLQKKTQSSYIFKAIIIGNLLYCIFKISVVALVYLRILSFQGFLNIMNYFGVEPITLEILPRLIRVQTISDVLTPFLILVVTKESPLHKKYKYTILLIFIVSLFLSYARLLWIVAIFSLIMNSPKMRISTKNLGAIVAMIIITVLSLLYFPLNIIVDRFFSNDTYASDTARSTQIKGLLVYFEEKPILGHGLGSYVPGLLRDNLAPYTYEVQWLAFLMQLGVLGLILLLFILFAGLVFIIYRSESTTWPFMYIVWLLMSFTNPYLTSSVSGVVFFVLLSLGGQNKVSQYGITILKSLDTRSKNDI